MSSNITFNKDISEETALRRSQDALENPHEEDAERISQVAQNALSTVGPSTNLIQTREEVSYTQYDLENLDGYHIVTTEGHTEPASGYNTLSNTRRGGSKVSGIRNPHRSRSSLSPGNSTQGNQTTTTSTTSTTQTSPTEETASQSIKNSVKNSRLKKNSALAGAQENFVERRTALQENSSITTTTTTTSTIQTPQIKENASQLIEGDVKNQRLKKNSAKNPLQPSNLSHQEQRAGPQENRVEPESIVQEKQPTTPITTTTNTAQNTELKSTAKKQKIELAGSLESSTDPDDNNSEQLSPVRKNRTTTTTTTLTTQVSQTPKDLLQPTHMQTLLDRIKSILQEYSEETGDSVKDKLTKKLTDYLENTDLVDAEVLQIYELLFTSSLGAWCQEQCEQEVSYISPNPFYVISSLVSCLNQLPKEKDFEAIKAEGEKHVNNMRYLEQIDETAIFPISKYLQSGQKTYLGTISQCLIYTATDWFGTSNQNSVFILKDDKLNPKWVFKLFKDPDNRQQDPVDNIGNEYYAFKMNFHRQFPIPATYLMTIKGVEGSIQMLIPNTLEIDKILRKDRCMMREDFQKLLIFDLLFLNCDRNPSNLLYQKSGNTYRCYGIDHEKSFYFSTNAYSITQINRLNEISSIQSKDTTRHHQDSNQQLGPTFLDFDDSIRELFSADNCNEYIRILQESLNKRCDPIDSESFFNEKKEIFDWIKDTGKLLRESEKTISEVFSLIQDLYKRKSPDSD